MVDITGMRMIILQPRDHALLHALSHARVLTVRQIHKYFFSKASRDVCRNRLNKLAGSRFIENVRSKAGCQVGVSHGVWALDKNGFNVLNIKKKDAFRGAFSIIHQLNLNDIMLEFYDKGQNEGVLWNPDGFYRYQTEIGNFEPDAVIFNPKNEFRVFLEYDNSTKYRGPLVENLSKYIAWYSGQKDQRVFLHYSVNDIKRASFIMDSFKVAFEKNRELFHLTEQDLIPLSVSVKEETHKQLGALLHDEEQDSTEESPVKRVEQEVSDAPKQEKKSVGIIGNLPKWVQTGS